MSTSTTFKFQTRHILGDSKNNTDLTSDYRTRFKKLYLYSISFLKLVKLTIPKHSFGMGFENLDFMNPQPHDIVFPFQDFINLKGEVFFPNLTFEMEKVHNTVFLNELEVKFSPEMRAGILAVLYGWFNIVF